MEKKLIQKVRERRNEKKRVPLTITLPRETIAKMETLAKETGVTLSFFCGEVLELGMSIGESVEIVSDKFTELTGRFLANQKTAKKVLKKVSKEKPKKGVKQIQQKFNW